MGTAFHQWTLFFSSPRWISFLRALDTDSWILHPTDSEDEFSDQIQDLWLQGTFVNFTPEEVHIYASILWMTIRVVGWHFSHSLPFTPSPPPDVTCGAPLSAGSS